MTFAENLMFGVLLSYFFLKIYFGYFLGIF